MICRPPPTRPGLYPLFNVACALPLFPAVLAATDAAALPIPGATLAALPAPAFYTTLWFYALCAVVAAGLIIGAVRWQMRRLQAENDRLEAKVRARTDELAHSLSLLKATLDSSADGILAIHFSGEVVTYNTPFVTMWDLPPSALVSDAAIRAATAARVKDPEKFLTRIAAVHARPDEESFDTIELKDGRLLERHCKPQRIEGRSVGIVINFRDITERRRAEEALRASENFLHSLVENLPVHIFRKDRAGRITFANRLYCERYGRPFDQLVGLTSADLRPPAEAERTEQTDYLIRATGQPYQATEEQMLPNGERRFIQIIKVPILDDAGQCSGIQGMFLDVTEAKLAEARLAEASGLLDAMMENTPDFIYFKDRDSRFVRVSRSLLARLPDPLRMRDQTDFDLFSLEHAQKAFDDEREIMRTGQPLVGVLEKETHLDGRITWALTTKIPWRNPDGLIVGTFGISKDITALKETEARLAEAHRQLVEISRQAGMAEVATGVLHNVGNVLNSVNVSSTLVMEQVRESKISHLAKVADLLHERAADIGSFIGEDPRGRRIPGFLATLAHELAAEQRTILAELEHLRKNIDHIKDIVAMQQNYAKVSGVPERVSLVELLEDALRINEDLFTSPGLEIVRDYQTRPLVSVERHQVLQILVNVLRNAKHACDESGRADPRIVLHVAQFSDRVTIAVTDNGVGIPAENLTRIFSHGFTTRKEGHGFGLHSGALAAREMGGSLAAQSDGPGQGATFTLELPLAPPAG